MSELAKTARAAMRAKAERMTGEGSAKNAGPGSDPSKRIDASGWSEPTMNADAKTGMRPVSRRQFKNGGHVSGEHTKHRADRKARKNGGHVNAKINRDVRAANAEIAKPHVGGFADGGATNFRKQMHGAMGVAENLHGRRNGVGKFHRSHKADGGKTDDGGRGQYNMSVKAKNLQDDNEVKKLYRSPVYDPMGPEQVFKRVWDTGSTKYKRGGRVHKDVGGVLSALSPALLIEKGMRGGKLDEGLKRGGRTHKASGGSTGYADIAGTRPKGDRIPRKRGGKTKGKTNIVIGIHAGGPQQQPQQMPQGPMPHPAAAPPPPPAMPPQGAPPMGAGGPPGMMPPGMGMPMPRKAGGKVVGAKYGDASIAKAERVKSPKGIPAGGGGLGRLAKRSIAQKDGFRAV
jgi:hypothetical protein